MRAGLRLVGFENLDDFQECYFEARDNSEDVELLFEEEPENNATATFLTGTDVDRGARASVAAGPGAGQLGKAFTGAAGRSITGVRGLYPQRDRTAFELVCGNERRHFETTRFHRSARFHDTTRDDGGVVAGGF